MAWPQVTVNQLNLQQGEINEVERTLLFVGKSTLNPGTLTFVTSQTDFTDLVSDGQLKDDLLAAQLNAGQNWQGWVLALDEGDKWDDAVRAVQKTISVEGVVLSDATADKKNINDATVLRAELAAKNGRWTWFILAVEGLTVDAGTAAGVMLPVPEPENDTKEGRAATSAAATDVTITESWSEYIARLTELQDGISSYSVQLVPRLLRYEPGMLAGRLCNRAVTIADSPARVKTGPLVMPELVEMPVDSDGKELELSTLQALEMARYSVPMQYTDYDGWFWSDGRTLDAEGGDYQSIENVRIVDKVSRRVRLMAIVKIGDRTLNSTPASIAANESYFARPMREMSRAMQINGVLLPGEVKPPKDGDVVISWETTKKVIVGVIVRPYEIPLGITVNIALDTTMEATS